MHDIMHHHFTTRAHVARRAGHKPLIEIRLTYSYWPACPECGDDEEVIVTRVTDALGDSVDGDVDEAEMARIESYLCYLHGHDKHAHA